MGSVIAIKRQKQIIDLFENGALGKLKENDLACLLGYIQGMVANAELNEKEKETKK